ncbi:hypothetical protein H8957_017840, partial [Semnopithecus entellus]
EEIDRTLAVQQYIQQNIRADCSNIDKILEPSEEKYGHLRQFCLELNGLVVKLQSECHPDTSYTRHTLDGAACLLNGNKYFTSRVTKLGSVCLRIYRIFLHAYFQNWQIFDEYENEIFLCHRFTKFMKYDLMSCDNLIIPILEEEVQNSVSGESEARRESYGKMY